jgi:hypothetical protein
MFSSQVEVLVLTFDRVIVESVDIISVIDINSVDIIIE